MAKTIDQIATGNLPVLSKVLRFNKLLVFSSLNLSHRWLTNRQLKLIHNYDLSCYQRKVLQILLMMFVLENPFWFWCRTKCWLLIFFYVFFVCYFLIPFIFERQGRCKIIVYFSPNFFLSILVVFLSLVCHHLNSFQTCITQ